MDNATETALVPKTIIDIRFDSNQIQVVTQLDINTTAKLFNAGFDNNQRKIAIPTLSGNALNIILSKIIFYAFADVTPEMLASMQANEKRQDSAIIPGKMGIVGPDGKTMNVPTPQKPRLQ